DWQSDLDAKEAVGRLQWMEVEGKINGPLQADFKRIALGDDNKPEQAKSSEKASALPDDIDVPELNLTVDELILSGRRLGQLELHGVSEQAGRVWRLSELALSSPSADLLGSGRWVLS